jgi:glycosyltransferase involved in cell wall biosynthesis
LTHNTLEQRENVAVVNLFYAHYRKAVMQKLLQSTRYRYILYGDTYDVTNSGIETWIPDDPSQFIRIPARRVWRHFYSQRGLLHPALRRDIVAIIYTGDVQYLSVWVSASVARLTGKRVFFWTHGWRRAENGPKAWGRRSFYHLAHSLLLYGQRAKEIGVQQGFDPGRFYIIFNSLDYERQKQLRESITSEQIQATRRQYFEHPERPMLIYVGRLIPRKRLDILLEASSELTQRGYPVNTLIVGEGPELERLARICSQRKLSVRFVGGCYDEATLALLIMSADVTVSPGDAGLLVMHSLAYGTPIITHDCLDWQGPEVEAIVPGKNGALFHYDDHHDLATKILEWTQAQLLSEDIQEQCYGIIDKYYNPEYQRTVIEKAVSDALGGVTEFFEC